MLFRSKLRLTFEFNSSQLFGGQLIAYYLPSYQEPTDNLLSIGNALVSPHVIIPMNTTDGIVFEPPIVYPEDYLVAGGDTVSRSMGTLVIMPLVEMAVPTHDITATVRINITAQLYDVDLFHPTIRSDVQLQSEQLIKSTTGIIDSVVGKTVEYSRPLIKNTIAKLTGDSVLTKGITGILGLSKPSSVRHGDSNEPQSTVGVEYAQGLVNARSYALSPSPNMCTDPVVFGVDMDNGN